MKKIIPIFFILAVFIGIICFICSQYSYKGTEPGYTNATKIVGEIKEEKDKRYSNSIEASNGFVFNCSYNGLIGIDEENGDFRFSVRNPYAPINSITISCNKDLTKVMCYSYKDKCIYCKKINKDYFEVERTYCNEECKYIVFLIEGKERNYYAKFIRNN